MVWVSYPIFWGFGYETQTQIFLGANIWYLGSYTLHLSTRYYDMCFLFIFYFFPESSRPDGYSRAESSIIPL